MIEALRALAGDALLAVGELVRGGSPNVDGWVDPTYQIHTQSYGWHTPQHVGAMESDGPDLTQPIPTAELRSAVYDLPDSELLGVAATVIDGWTPLLLRTARASTDVDVLVAALRDRAAQFAAVELEAGEPFLTIARLGAPLTSSAQSASE